MLKIGFIGNGKSTNRYQLPFFMRRDDTEGTMIYSRNLNKRLDRIIHLLRIQMICLQS